MALKDWKKLGEDRYKLKNGIGEVWIESRSYYSVNRDMSSGTRNRYYFYHHYLGAGGHPDPKTFDSKVKAHAHLMKHVKTKDY